jgi:hypothetical protein
LNESITEELSRELGELFPIITDQTQRMRALEYDGANYGYMYELKELSKKGLVFVAQNGSGGTYGPGLTVSDGKQCLFVDISEDEVYLVKVDDDGKVMPDDLKNLRKFIKVLKSVKKLLET